MTPMARYFETNVILLLIYGCLKVLTLSVVEDLKVSTTYSGNDIEGYKGPFGVSVFDVTWRPPTASLEEVVDYLVAWELSSGEDQMYFSDPIPSNPNFDSYRYRIHPIIQGACYNVNVRSRNAEGLQASPATPITLYSAAAVPVNITFGADEDGREATVSWVMQGEFRVSHYYIRLNGPTGQDYAYYTDHTGPTNYSMPLVPGSYYPDVLMYCNVQTECGYDSSMQASQSISFVTKPGTATNLLLFGINGTNDPTSDLILSWQTPNSFPWQQYRVILETTSNRFISSELYFSHQFLTPVTLQTQLTSLAPAETYAATVVILNQFFGTDIAGDESEPSNLQLTVPSAPTVDIIYELRNSNCSGTSFVHLSWGKPDGGEAVDAYIVTWWVEGYSSFTETSAPVLHVHGQATYNYITPKLLSGSTYGFHVSARNAAGSSTSSNHFVTLE